MRTQSIIVANIHVGDRWRTNLNEKTVEGLVESIGILGLRNPMSVIFRNDVEIDGQNYDGVPVLVAGRHRLEAIRRLGWKTVECDVFSDEIAAEKWEISENIHRADLTIEQRGAQVKRWIDLTIEQMKREGNPQNLQVAKIESKRADGKGHRPEGGVDAAARELGLESTEAHRLVSIGGLSETARETARQVGLDDNQTALLAAARDGKTIVKQAKAEGKSEDDEEVQRAKAAAEAARIEKEAEDRRRKAEARANKEAEGAAPTDEVIAPPWADEEDQFRALCRAWGDANGGARMRFLEWAGLSRP